MTAQTSLLMLACLSRSGEPYSRQGRQCMWLYDAQLTLSGANPASPGMSCLQECQLPTLDFLHPLLKFHPQAAPQDAQQQYSATQQSPKHQQLAILQLTDAMFSSHQCSRQRRTILGPAEAHAAAFPDRSQHNSKPLTALHTAEQVPLAALQQHGSIRFENHQTSLEARLRELSLNQWTNAFYHPRGTHTRAHLPVGSIIELLQLSGCQVCPSHSGSLSAVRHLCALLH